MKLGKVQAQVHSRQGYREGAVCMARVNASLMIISIHRSTVSAHPCRKQWCLGNSFLVPSRLSTWNLWTPKVLLAVRFSPFLSSPARTGIVLEAPAPSASAMIPLLAMKSVHIIAESRTARDRP